MDREIYLIYGMTNHDPYLNEIEEITKYFVNKYKLEEYIHSTTFSYEEVIGESHEDAINYNVFDRELIISIPELSRRFIPHQNNEKDSYIYNTMILVSEIIFGLKKVELYKITNDKDDSTTYNIITLEEDFKRNRRKEEVHFYTRTFDKLNKNYNKYILKNNNYHKTNKNYICYDKNIMSLSDRIIKIDAYNETIDIFTKLCNKSNAYNWFMQNNLDILLNGYIEKEYLTYPILNYFSTNKDINSNLYLNSFKWYDKEYIRCLSNASSMYNLNERLKYGMPIDLCEYKNVLSRKYKY